MNPDLRDRFFLPIVLPLGILAVFVGAAYALSRILLTVPSLVATIIALVLTAVTLGVVGYAAMRARVNPRSATIALVSALVVVFAGGTLSAAAGPRADLAELIAPPGVADEALFVAIDIDFLEAPEVLRAGEHEFVLENRGRTRHSVVIRELGDERVVLARPGETETGTVSLEPGDYYYFCDIADHEERGMFGDLRVTD